MGIWRNPTPSLRDNRPLDVSYEKKRIASACGHVLGPSMNPAELPEASAQIVFGTIVCTVQDQDDAVIPKAGVWARNLETVAVLPVVTDTSGADRINSNSTPKLVPDAGQPKSPTVTTSWQVQAG